MFQKTKQTNNQKLVDKTKQQTNVEEETKKKEIKAGPLKNTFNRVMVPVMALHRQRFQPVKSWAAEAEGKRGPGSDEAEESDRTWPYLSERQD